MKNINLGKYVYEKALKDRNGFGSLDVMVAEDNREEIYEAIGEACRDYIEDNGGYGDPNISGMFDWD